MRIEENCASCIYSPLKKSNMLNAVADSNKMKKYHIHDGCTFRTFGRLADSDLKLSNYGKGLVV